MALRRLVALVALGPVAVIAASCGSEGELPAEPSSFAVVVTAVNGGALPTPDAPNPANRGDRQETWDFTVEARAIDGTLLDFNGVVRVSVVPGAVLNVAGEHAYGRNVQLEHGKAVGTATVTAVYGPARLWVQDLGYFPAAPGVTPACSNGVDDDDDKIVDFPADPGCAFPDDDSEEGGTYSGGASQQVEYELPSVVDVQGEASITPYPNDAVTINTKSPHQLVVTRVSSDGFYVTDLADAAKGYNHLFAFNFSTPSDMRPCDIVTYLAGTSNDFFGFTELNFPSYELQFPIAGVDPCLIPEPVVLDPTIVEDPVAMEKIESALVRIASGQINDTDPGHPNVGTYTDMTWRLPTKFGPDPVLVNAPTTNGSNCDLNGDGQVDFEDPAEGGCSNACDADPQCSEWTSFTARGNIKVAGTYFTVDKPTGAKSQPAVILTQINIGPATLFDPSAHKGQELTAISGTLRNFSGGNLNWTVEARCQDDVVCPVLGCAPAIVPVDKACITLRTVDDNDESTD